MMISDLSMTGNTTQSNEPGALQPEALLKEDSAILGEDLFEADDESEAGEMPEGIPEALSDAERQMVSDNLALVHFVVGQMARGLSDRANRDELFSAGVIGLIGAVRSFDGARGSAFSTFAAPRIRGAILDDLRRVDHVPRSVRRKAREIDVARSALVREGAEVNDDLLAERLGVAKTVLWEWQHDVARSAVVEIDAPARGREGKNEGERMPSLAGSLGGEWHDPLELMGREEDVARLREAIGELRDQERTVLVLSYFEELKLNEIAQLLQVTESRVSQIRSKAIARLRESMRDGAN